MSFAGTWDISIDTPMGSQNVKLTLEENGSELTGSMHSPQGDLEISDGKVDGDQASWTGSLTQPMPITLEFKAKLEGDAISGDVNLGSFGSASFKGTRA